MCFFNDNVFDFGDIRAPPGATIHHIPDFVLFSSRNMRKNDFMSKSQHFCWTGSAKTTHLLSVKASVLAELQGQSFLSVDQFLVEDEPTTSLQVAASSM